MVVVNAFSDAILKLDLEVPTGSYVDMSINLPVCQPEKLLAPVMIMRGQFDGIAHSSLYEKNLAIFMRALEGFFEQPKPVYVG